MPIYNTHGTTKKSTKHQTMGNASMSNRWVRSRRTKGKQCIHQQKEDENGLKRAEESERARKKRREQTMDKTN